MMESTCRRSGPPAFTTTRPFRSSLVESLHPTSSRNTRNFSPPEPIRKQHRKDYNGNGSKQRKARTIGAELDPARGMKALMSTHLVAKYALPLRARPLLEVKSPGVRLALGLVQNTRPLQSQKAVLAPGGGSYVYQVEEPVLHENAHRPPGVSGPEISLAWGMEQESPSLRRAETKVY